MPLDPKAKALLTAIAVAGDPAIDKIPLSLAREQVEKGYARMKIPSQKVHSNIDILIPGPAGNLPARIYYPSDKENLPLLLFFHGGGWVFFHLDAYDPICTHLCQASECIVVSVDYRLAPEYKFPAATDDCLAATKWMAAHAWEWKIDPDRIILAGDSAGGNLATVTALRIRDEGGPALSGQVLIYPVTDYTQPEKASYHEFSEGYGLTREAMFWFWEKYLDQEEDKTNPYAIPLLAENLSGLPPALIIVTGYDPLKDEGIAYARRLDEAGVTVKLSVYEDMIHGFLSYIGILKQAKTAIGEISTWIKKTVN